MLGGSDLTHEDRVARRRPTVGELLRSILVPCALFISLQFLGLVLHITGAAHRTNWPGTLATVCSSLAWLVLLVGLVRLVAKVRAR